MFNSDKPIDSAERDCLNRSNFSKQLAKAIISYSNTNNCTISLCGKWGCGKTSIINMTINEINRLTRNFNENKKPIIIQFNPWNYSDGAQLVSQFFQTLSLKINLKNNSKLSTAGDVLDKYSSLFDYTAYIPIIGKYLDPLKSVISSLGVELKENALEKNSLENQKSKVIKALNELDQKIIVIIDDIDRLNNKQIRLIFQLVNSIAGFPNMIYLLSFDKNIVERALSDEQNCDGAEYLEKIIQVPFDVPDADISLIHKMLFNNLENIIKDDLQNNNFDKVHWNDVFSFCVSPFIKTIRDVNRIINAFQFKYSFMKNETNCIDLLAVTVAQIYDSSLYKWISNNIRILTGSMFSEKGISQIEQNNNKSKYIELFKKISKMQPEIAIQFVSALFPTFSWKIGGNNSTNYTNDELLQRQMIASRERSNIYFCLSLENITISKEQILSTINDYSKEQLCVFFDKLMKENILYDYVHLLSAYADQISEDKQRLFIDELIRLQTIESNYKSDGMFDPIPGYECNRCCWKILKCIDKEKVCSVLLSIITDMTCDNLPIIADILYYIERSYGKIGEDFDYEHRIIDKEQLGKIETLLLSKISDLSYKFNFFDTISFLSIYRIWHFLENKSCDDYIRNKLSDAENVPKYLYMISGYWNGGQDSGWTFNEEKFSEVISKKDAYDKINSIKKTNAFSNLEYKYKEIAVAYYIWYNNFGSDYHNVSKKMVNEMIPEWDIQKKRQDYPA